MYNNFSLKLKWFYILQNKRNIIQMWYFGMMQDFVYFYEEVIVSWVVFWQFMEFFYNKFMERLEE